METITTMKAITIWQPWASLKACGAKEFETRGWKTKYRGPIAIHAAVLFNNSFPKEFSDASHEALRKNLPGFTYMYELPRGAIIATAELIGCWEIDSIQEMDGAPWETGYWGDRQIWYDVSEQELLFGDWTPGRYAWEFANMRMLETPIPAKGKQGLWNWTPPEGVLIA